MGYVVIQLWEKKGINMAETKKEVAKVETTVPVLSKGQKFTVDLIKELDESMKVMDVSFTEYGKNVSSMQLQV